MYAIVLVGFLACASAGPYWGHHHSAPSPFDDNFGSYISDHIFDTKRFWDELNRNLRREMMSVENMMSDFKRHFPSASTKEGIVGNEYRIEIPLTGFTEQDIVVKARRGMLMIQAVNKVNGRDHNNYLDIRTLPACVSEHGSWSYEKGILKVILPLLEDDSVNTDNEEGPVNPTTVRTVNPTTDRSREETERPYKDPLDGDADVGRGDLSKTQVLLHNEIPNVEATTYAVDYKDEVEFVPVRRVNV